MKKINYDNIIKSLLKNKRIKKEKEKNNLTNKQIRDSLPLFIDIANQDIKNSKYIISCYVTEDGNVKRQELLSPSGFIDSWMSRVLSQKFLPINFEYEKEFIKNKDQAEIIKQFAPYLNDTMPSIGLYIHGNMGIGKSFLAKRIAKKLAEKGRKIAFANLSALSSKLKSSFSSESISTNNIMNILREVEILFLDDIGSESVTEWFRDDVLFSILNFRMEHHKITFFTSNYSIEELEKKQAKTTKTKYLDFHKARRLVERIKAIAKPVLFTGKNLRY